MPKMNFTNSLIESAKLCERQTWFTDAHPKTGHNRYPGLRLCISKTGKVFYVAKWDPHAEKTRTVKLGRFAQTFTLPMAWAQAQSEAQQIEQPPEPEQEAMEPLPTLREAVDEYVTYRRNLNPKVGKPMSYEVAKKYRACVAKDLTKWLDLPIDQLPTLEIRRHLNALQAEKPYAAQYVHSTLGVTMRHQNNERDLDLKIPSLTTATKTAKADIDREASWEDRWAEIEDVENVWERAAWVFRFHTGVRITAFRELKWVDVNFDFGTVSLPDDKRVEARVVGVSDFVLDTLRDLPRINEYVFASRRAPGHIGDRLRSTRINVAQHLRHLWHDVLDQTECSRLVGHWLAGQTDEDIQGHYTIPSIEKQRIAANAISDYIMSRAKPDPSNVLDLVGRRS